MYILSEELKSLYPAFLSTTSFAQDAFSECVFNFFFASCYVTSRIRIRMGSEVSRLDPDPVQNGPDPQSACHLLFLIIFMKQMEILQII